MKTNDKPMNDKIDDNIVRAEVPAYIKDTLNLFQKEIQQGETDYFGMLTRLAVIIDTKARADQKAWDNAQEEEYTEIAKRQSRADTAKQIFNELKNMRTYNEDIDKGDCDGDIIIYTDILTLKYKYLNEV